MTTTTPKCLTDLRYQDHVQITSNLNNVDTMANRFFHELFDEDAHVFVNFLFQEDGEKVYECYQDGGSVDYLYIIVK